jgi:histidine triad (HIT) family protein
MADCLFCRIVAGEIPAKMIYTDERAVAFSDINPQAPLHALVVPRKHVASLAELGDDDRELCGHLFQVAAKLAAADPRCAGGWRTVVNTGADAGQTVFHLHVHVLGGRSLDWPPG